jgi:hypothetical protein
MSALQQAPELLAMKLEESARAATAWTKW